MRKKQSEPEILTFFVNRTTMQSCWNKKLTKKLNLTPGRKKAVEVCEEEQTIRIKPGMAVIYDYDPPTVFNK